MKKELIHSGEILEYRPTSCVSFILNGQLISLPFDEIIRARTWVAGTIIITEEKSYRCYLTIEELERALPVNDFFRVNPVHILAIRHISGWKERAALVGNRHFSLTKSKRIELTTKLGHLLNTNYDLFYAKGV